VVSGGILKLWADFLNFMEKPIYFVRHKREDSEVLGVYVPERKMAGVRRCLEKHFGAPNN